MKLVALDVGEKRIGVATADSAVRIAVPRGTIKVDGDELMQIVGMMRDERSQHLIVGLPRNAQGEETAQSRMVRAFVTELLDYVEQNKSGKLLVKYQDESLTSVMAEERLGTKKHKKRRGQIDVDSEAAAIILQDFLDGFSGELSFPVEGAKKSKVQSKGKKKVKHLAFKILALIVGLIVVSAGAGIMWYIGMTKPVASEGDCHGINPEYAEKCVSLDFVVTEGESTRDIIDRLESDGLIRSALAFSIYMRLNHAGAVIRVGSYRLASYMSISDIINKLSAGTLAETFRITFLPGGTVADAKKRLSEAGYSEEEIAEGFAVEYEHPVFGGGKSSSLEGYIFGETYEFYATATVEQILVRTFDELYDVIQENDLASKYDTQGLSLHEGLILASIIQKEAHESDMAQVAQVFLLRLARDIPLGSCAVIGYKADQIDPDRDPKDMSYLNTIKDCPWASRTCKGLPPNPISSPGKAALLAAASPANGSYLYFLTDDDGKMRYAYTEVEHNNNIKNYCKIRCNYL